MTLPSEGSGPFEVWLTKQNIQITCRIFYEDETSTDLEVESLSMRGAQREITSWLIARGLEPAGRWESEDDRECSRRFRPRSAAPVTKTGGEGFIKAAGFLEVWNSQGQNVGERQACRFAWRLGQGGAEHKLLSSHRIHLSKEGGRNLVIVDKDGGLLWAHPIAAFPIGVGELSAGGDRL